MNIEITEELKGAILLLHPDWNGLHSEITLCKDISQKAWIGLKKLKIVGNKIIPATLQDNILDLLLVERTKLGVMLYVQTDQAT